MNCQNATSLPVKMQGIPNKIHVFIINGTAPSKKGVCEEYVYTKRPDHC